MSQTKSEMQAEIEEMYREVPNHPSWKDCDPTDDPTHEAFSIKPHGVEHNEAYDKCMNIVKQTWEHEREYGQIKATEVQSYQVGGTHYAKHKIQPWDVIDEYGLNFYEGNALKYMLRRKGNRLEDLQKAKHYIEKLIDEETKANTR